MSQDNEKIDWDAISFVARSGPRTAVVSHLRGGPATPSEIDESTDHELNRISRALQQLREEGLCQLLVSEETKRGRYYGLTNTARDIAKTAEELGDR